MRESANNGGSFGSPYPHNHEHRLVRFTRLLLRVDPMSTWPGRMTRQSRAAEAVIRDLDEDWQLAELLKRRLAQWRLQSER